MKLSISNIAWAKDNDAQVYLLMKKYGYTGIEIAPTRLVSEQPYIHNNLIKVKNILTTTGFEVSSAQSILYGRDEKLFGDDAERQILKTYLCKAVDYASYIGCKNLVFGSPKNRIINDFDKEYDIALNFFRSIGNYAEKYGVIIAIEPNPKIYGTNFINNTMEAYNFVKDIKSPNIKINYDLGTVIENNEAIYDLEMYYDKINHIHISEPYLELIKPRDIHKEIFKFFKAKKYDKYISIEMKKQDNIHNIEYVLKYISEMNI